MSQWIDYTTALLGRIFVGGFFLWTGVLNALSFAEVSSTLAALRLPYPVELSTLIIVIEVCAGAAMVIGWRVRAAALTLAAYLLVMTPLVHSSFGDSREVSLFFENIALVGALLYISAKEKPIAP